MSYAYRIVGGKDNEQSLYFMLNALLQARIETGEESTDDEDVNVYLASLLHSLLDSQTDPDKKVSSYDTAVALQLEGADTCQKYEVYRLNADHALLGVALFDRPWLERNGSCRNTGRLCGGLGARGRHYYGVADSLQRKRKYGANAVSDVMGKLSDRFDTYTHVLRHVRSSHLNLFARLTVGETYHLERKAQEAARPALIQHGRDAFLDAYNDRMVSASDHVRRRVTGWVGHSIDWIPSSTSKGSDQQKVAPSSDSFSGYEASPGYRRRFLFAR